MPTREVVGGVDQYEHVARGQIAVNALGQHVLHALSMSSHTLNIDALERRMWCWGRSPPSEILYCWASGCRPAVMSILCASVSHALRLRLGLCSPHLFFSPTMAGRAHKLPDALGLLRLGNKGPVANLDVVAESQHS